MGTRHLIIVYLHGQYRVAQYGQWDGYPEGAGVECLRFLRDEMDEIQFKGNLIRTKWIDDKKLEFMLDKFNGYVPPEFHRDTGVQILRMIQNDEILTNRLYNDIEFAADSVFCEWAWVIDFDRKTFEAYKGFNGLELTNKDRFYFLRNHESKDSEYHGVKLVYEWRFNDLPTDEQFLKILNYEDSESE